MHWAIVMHLFNPINSEWFTHTYKVNDSIQAVQIRDQIVNSDTYKNAPIDRRGRLEICRIMEGSNVQ